MISGNEVVNTGSSSGSPILDIQSAGSGFTQYALDALKSLTDFVKRHQLVGSRALDRFYARFGKSLSAEKLNRSVYIGADNIPLQFGDVFSTANTDSARLGDYAGKGLAYGGNEKFEYNTDEYGMFIIVNSIVPKVNYYGGQDRVTLHVNPLDFWTPEFDQLGVQAMSKAEVFSPMGNEEYNFAGDLVLDRLAQWSNPDLTDTIFGFTPRYSEYKVGRDRLTGDYRMFDSAGDTSDAWHLFRNPLLQTNGGSAQTFVHDHRFVQGYDYQQYNRIFYNTDTDFDKFYIIHNFDVVSHSPMKPLYETYEFEDKGKKVLADVNGVKVN